MLSLRHSYIVIIQTYTSFLQTWEECTQYFRVDEERGLSPGQVKHLLSSYFLKFTYFHFLIFTSLVSRWRSTRRSTAPTVSSSTISDVNVDEVMRHTHACHTWCHWQGKQGDISWLRDNYGLGRQFQAGIKCDSMLQWQRNISRQRASRCSWVNEKGWTCKREACNASPWRQARGQKV